MRPYSLTWCQKLMDIMLSILERYLISRLKFIRQIQKFLPAQFSDEEEEITNLLKQLADYDFSAETIRKIEQKYYKKWF